MALVSLDEAREYLRVDSHDEDAMIGILLESAGQMCADVARLSDEQWESINTERTEQELQKLRAPLRVAMLYSLGYLFEHREEADHHELMLTLRSLLFAVREGVL